MNKFFVILMASVMVGLASGAATKDRPFHTVDFNHYWTLEEINDYFMDLIEEFPSLVSLEDYGTTSQGRPLQAFVVRRGAPKPTIVIEAGLRPREWLAPMAALYFIHEVVEHDYDYDDVLDFVDLVFVTVANPDGYVYTHTTDRAWNKNRRTVSSTCVGVDLNRNFGYEFQSGNDACSDNYPGSFAFSEAESRSIREVLVAYQGRVRMFLSLQASGQQITVPYNYLPISSQNHATLIALGNRVADAIRSAPGQRSYAVGIGGVLRGIESGTSGDYAYETRQVTLSYALRLPSGGSSGWDFPVAQLPAVLSETFRGFLVFARHVASS